MPRAVVPAAAVARRLAPVPQELEQALRQHHGGHVLTRRPAGEFAIPLVAMVACACPRAVPTEQAASQDSCPIPPTAVCDLYLVATGESLDAPPGAWVIPAQGTPLTITAVDRGNYEVGVGTTCGYRGFVIDPAADAVFAETFELETGVIVSAGARARLYADIEGIAVAASNGHRYLVPCSAFARNAITEPSAPTYTRPMYVAEDQTLVSIYGDRLLELPAGNDQQVDLLERREDKAMIRVWLGGFEYKGLVEAKALAIDAPEFGSLNEGNDEDFVPMPLSHELGATCEGTAILRRGSVPATGPRIPDNREQAAARKLPAIGRDADVVVRRMSGDDRLVEIANPAPEIASVIAWVDAADLDDDPCVVP
jgi:hypothetical protein